MKSLLFLLSLVILFLPVTISAHSEVKTVEMTPDGFEPAAVTIDVSSAVIFVNKDKEAHWPASNNHPTHEIYPEFDPRKPIQPGQSWSFRPTRTGTFKYHDHIFPHKRGILEVVGEKDTSTSFSVNPERIEWVEKLQNFAERIINKIKNLFNSLQKKESTKKQDFQARALSSEKFKVLSPEKQVEELKKITDDLGSKKAWEYVKETFKGEGGSSGNIHDLAHLTGSLIYSKEDFPGLAFCTVEFAFGCYHGFLDKAFQKDLSRLEDAHKACVKLSGNVGESQVGGPAASCIHGIGHGIASYFSTQDLKKALGTCRKLPSGSEFCFDGVFMEFVRSVPLSFFKKDDPLYPCDELEKNFGYVYSLACGRNQTTLLLSRFNYKFEDVVNVCLSFDSKEFQAGCIDSLGYTAAKSPTVSQMAYMCKHLGISDLVARCTKAAAGELVFQEIPNWQENAFTLCSFLEGQGLNECKQYVDSIISQYGKQVKKNPNLYIREQLKKCYDTQGKDGCYKEVAEVLYNQFGLAKILSLLKTNENYPEVYARCHEVTHYLSRLEYDKLKSIAGVYAQCDSTCHGGCYHGTMEAYLKDRNLEGDNLLKEFPKVCGKPQDYQKPIEFNECVHGLGHAAMFITDVELIQSLTLCDTIPEQEYKERCYSGVFMENSSSSTSFDHESKFIKKDDPFYPCNFLDEKYQKLCWQYQSSYFSIINDQDWVKVADLCLQIPKQYQIMCFRTIGTNQVGFTSSLDIMKKDCDLMPTGEFRNICVTGVVSSLTYRFVEDAQKMIDFCNLVNSENKESCFKQMGTGLLDWDKDKNKAKEHCSKIEDPKGANWCMSVI